ncbi:MAG: CopD family protein [Actinomycetota bacterium]|nr:CopD family protein [Actinomycetota bacterium]
MALVSVPASAGAHASFLESQPAAGHRVERPPARVVLEFTEPINARLTKVELIDVGSGDSVAVQTAKAAGRQLELRPTRELAQGAYRVRWHSVSTVDAHVREGYFSFGVQSAAVGTHGLVNEGPLARSGWVRVLARLGLYATLLVFAGGLLLSVLLRGRYGGSWLAVPPAARRDTGIDPGPAQRRAATATLAAGSLAAVLAIAVALAEGADAAGGVSLAILTDFLLGNPAGTARLAVPLLVAGGLWAARRGQSGIGAVLATCALGAIAASGHAASAGVPLLAVTSAWVHLLAGAVWLGGIVLLAIAWGPALRELSSAARLALARSVLPRFGRVALYAFVVVVLTGAVNSAMELASVDDLWTTAYGRVLLAKIAVVMAMAAVSLTHARWLRPRLLRDLAPAGGRAERSHWRLVRLEPALGAGALVAVAFLVGFPTPPREAAEAQAAAQAQQRCDPCPLPVPKPAELSVADWTGKRIVAAWIQQRAGGLEGEVRLLTRDGSPVDEPFTVHGARLAPCGPGCRRFWIEGRPEALRVRVAGTPEPVELGARWRAEGNDRARRLVAGAFQRLREAPTVRLAETVRDRPGQTSEVDYRLKAPDRMAYRTSLGFETVAIDRRRWLRTPGVPWQQQAPPRVPYRTQNWLRSPIFIQGERLLRIEDEGEGRVAVVAYTDSGTPGWATAWIDLDTGRLRRMQLVVEGHEIEHRYSAYGEPITITAPTGAR